MDPPRPTYRIVLEALPVPGGAPPHRRLSRALKKLLREFGLRCRDARELGAGEPLTLEDLDGPLACGSPLEGK